MTDMLDTIVAKSDQLNSDDLMGGPIIIKITGVSKIVADQPIAINYEGDHGKPWKPGKSMRRVLVAFWGRDGKQYVGRSLQIYRDPTVKFGNMEVGGIRISHMTNIDKPMSIALTATRGSKKAFTVQPLMLSAPLAADDTPSISVEDWETDILAVPTLEGLQFKFSAAQKALKGNEDGLARVIAAKDKRKIELTTN